MTPDVFHLVKLIKRFNPEYSKKSFKEIGQYIDFYAGNEGLFWSTKDGQESILMARPISDIEDRMTWDKVDHGGDIIWMDFFFQNNVYCAANVLKSSINKWSDNKNWVAFHRGKDPDPRSYKIFDRKFCIKYFGRLIKIFNIT